MLCRRSVILERSAHLTMRSAAGCGGERQRADWRARCRRQPISNGRDRSNSRLKRLVQVSRFAATEELMSW
jgi:hypothetical protein